MQTATTTKAYFRYKVFSIGLDALEQNCFNNFIFCVLQFHVCSNKKTKTKKHHIIFIFLFINSLYIHICVYLLGIISIECMYRL